MSRRTLLTVFIASVAAAVAAAPAQAKPSFPGSYHGTASGTRNTSDGESRKLAVSWEISGLKFKRQHVRYRFGIYTAFYKLTAGTLKFHAQETGSCSYTLDETLNLTGIVDQKTSAPFTLTPKGKKFAIQGLVIGDKLLPVKETCPSSDPSEPPLINDREVNVGKLIDYGSKTRATRKAAKGKYTEKIDFASGSSGATATYNWSLKT